MPWRSEHPLGKTKKSVDNSVMNNGLTISMKKKTRQSAFDLPEDCMCRQGRCIDLRTYENMTLIEAVVTNVYINHSRHYESKNKIRKF